MRLGAKEIHWTSVGEREVEAGQKKAIWQKSFGCTSVGVLLCIYLRILFVIGQKEQLAIYLIHLKGSAHGLDTIVMLVPEGFGV